MDFKSIGIPTLKLFVIATVVTVLLFLTNSSTEAKIAQNQIESDIQSRQEVLPDADGFEEATVTVEGVEYTYYVATNGVGYVFSGSNKGYGGDVVSMVGINTNGEIVKVKVTEYGNETAGLGAKWGATDTAGDERRAQYQGAIPADGEFAVTKDGGTIEAVSGATITSRAVTRDVNDAIKQYNAVVGGAN
jgi:electron transport complex protein RnfG